MTVSDRFVQFLKNKSGGATLEFALVSTIVAITGLATIGAVQDGKVPFLASLNSQILQAVDEINRTV